MIESQAPPCDTYVLRQARFLFLFYSPFSSITSGTPLMFKSALVLRSEVRMRRAMLAVVAHVATQQKAVAFVSEDVAPKTDHHQRLLKPSLRKQRRKSLQVRLHHFRRSSI